MQAKLGKCKSIALSGLEGKLVEAQAHICAGVPSTTLVGLPDASLNEAKERIKAAVISCGVDWTEFRLTLNLTPGSIRKTGSGFDLPLAMATLASMDILDKRRIEDIVFIAELGLDGSLQGVPGILPAMIGATRAGITQVVVSKTNRAEAELIGGIQVLEFSHLSECINHFGGSVDTLPASKAASSMRNYKLRTEKAKQEKPLDFADVLGQNSAKHSLMVAVAGGHHLLMVGPPGTGKTMLAERLPSIMPNLAPAESLEVTSIHSIAGTLESAKLITMPPFEAPHHTATQAAIIGGGSSTKIRPGSVSRAHKGVLFMDEAPEFSPRVLQTLRQPLESGSITIDRAQSQVKYPAEFTLIMAANPCPCGMSMNKGVNCVCTSIQKQRYFSRLSGPLLDRIDMQIAVESISSNDLKPDTNSLNSAQMKERVLSARAMAAKRLENTPWSLNSQVPGSYLRRLLPKDSEITPFINNAVDKGILSLRGADRTLRLGWSIADLEGKQEMEMTHIEQALYYRTRIVL